MNFQPLHDNVLLRRADADERTAGGIIIPDIAKEKPQECTVVAVGPGRRNEAGDVVPMDVAEGDRVLIGKWSGTEVEFQRQQMLIAKQADILGVVAP